MDIPFRNFKGVRFSRAILYLSLSRLFMQIGFGLVSIYLPIFFYVEFGSLEIAILIFAVTFFGHALLTPVTAKLFAYMSLRTMMLIGIPFAFSGMLLLAFWEWNPWLITVLHITLLLIYKALYWVPYHVDFAKFTTKGTRGRQLSILQNAAQIVAIITPLIGGFIIVHLGFAWSFVIAAVFFALSIPPLLRIPKTREMFQFGFIESFTRLFKKQHRSLVLAELGHGAQGIISAVVWPIFIFGLFDEQYTTVGVVTAITVSALLVLRMLVGVFLDSDKRNGVLRFGSLVLMSGWVVKAFVETAFQVFLVETYHNIGRAMNQLSIDTAVYDQSADNGHYIDEFTVIKELALAAGRIGMLLLVTAIVTVTSIKAAFFVAAGASLLVTLINQRGYIE